jgi:hypothetical protein
LLYVSGSASFGAESLDFIAGIAKKIEAKDVSTVPQDFLNQSAVCPILLKAAFK